MIADNLENRCADLSRREHFGLAEALGEDVATVAHGQHIIGH
jgi:hypothetical protein